MREADSSHEVFPGAGRAGVNQQVPAGFSKKGLKGDQGRAFSVLGYSE